MEDAKRQTLARIVRAGAEEMLPRQLALLEQQLRALREVVTPETRIIAAAKARDVHNSTLALFEKILGTTTTSLAWKKARLIHCVFTAPELADAPQTYSWKLDGTPWTIHNLSLIHI